LECFPGSIGVATIPENLRQAMPFPPEIDQIRSPEYLKNRVPGSRVMTRFKGLSAERFKCGNI
jgi:hypothetical protein